MNILAIETSTKYLSVAIAKDASILASFQDRGQIQHFALLIPTIETLLKKTGLKFKDIDVIAISIGPGSFTGLRIGVATCKGLNMALGIPIVAVPTLDAIANNFIDAREPVLCPLIDAKKKKVYACLYKKIYTGAQSQKKADLKRLTRYMLLDIDALIDKIDKPTLVFGDAIKLYSDRLKKSALIHISNDDWYPSAEVIAMQGLMMAKRRGFANPDKLAPMYLHSQYCQVSR
ncbi:MAG: tRNA (adenosine(37)-N6)-threonylcarbamoyltransferase complex dimerization subunit type 1 TsaB [Candidatus Omnitrophota bacterium]